MLPANMLDKLSALVRKLVTHKSNPKQPNNPLFIKECAGEFQSILNSLSDYYDSSLANATSEVSKSDFMQQTLWLHGKSWVDTPLECVLSIKQQSELLKTFNDFCQGYGFALNYSVADPKTGDTPLHYACSMWNSDLMQVFASKDRINIQDMAGFTPAHFAAASKDKAQRLEELSKLGADLDIKSNSGLTPKDMLPNTDFDERGYNCFHMTKLVYVGYAVTLQQAKDLLNSISPSDRVAYLNSSDFSHKSPIIAAAYSGNVAVINLIHENGGTKSFNSSDILGYTAMHYAMTYHPARVDIIKALVEGGADYNKSIKQVRSAYDFSKQHGLTAIVRFFDEHARNQLLAQPTAIIHSPQVKAIGNDAVSQGQVVDAASHSTTFNNVIHPRQ